MKCSSVWRRNGRPTSRQRLTQQQADLAAREKALAEKEAAAAAKEIEPAATPRAVTPTDEEAESTDVVASSDREAPRSYDTFYRKLEPYGAWRETDDYGYVWQPRQSQQSRDWRPYTEWALGLHRCGMDLGFRGAFWLGHLSLRTLDALAERRLGLGSRRGMGACLGLMANRREKRGLGATATGSAFRARHRHQKMGRQLLRYQRGRIRFHP